MRLALYFAASAVAWFVGVTVAACASSPGSLSPAAYGAELLACIDRAATRAEADECRRRVDEAYGQLDAGADR